MTKKSWQKIKLENIAENLDNKRVPVTKEKRSKGDIPYYGATGIVDYIDDYIFDEELLLVGEDGADWSSFANTAYLVKGKSWVNNHAHVLRVIKANTSFLMEFLNYADLTLHTSGTTRGKLNKSDLMNLQIPLPDNTTQNKISLLFTSLNDQIIKTDQIIQKTEILKQGLMKGLLVKGIDHTKFRKTKIGEIPESWKLAELSEVASVERGKFSYRPRNEPRFYGGKIPFIQTGDVVKSNGRITTYSQTLNEQGLKISKLFRKGTIVLTIAANIGDTGILEFDACFPDSLVGITPTQELDTIYLEYFLRFRKDYLNSIATQSAQKNINLAKLNPMLIALPTLIEQKKIAEVLSSFDKKIAVETMKKAKLVILKKGLMQDIFSQRVQIN